MKICFKKTLFEFFYENIGENSIKTENPTIFDVHVDALWRISFSNITLCFLANKNFFNEK